MPSKGALGAKKKAIVWGVCSGVRRSALFFLDDLHALGTDRVAVWAPHDPKYRTRREGLCDTQLLVTDSVHGPPQEEQTLHFSTPLVPEHGT